MAKVTLEFDLMEEQVEYQLALNAWKWQNVVRELDISLRNSIKNDLKDTSEEIRNKLIELVTEQNLNMYD